MKEKITKAIKGIIKTLWTNKWDVISVAFWLMMIIFADDLAGWFAGGWVLAMVFYTVGVFATAVHLPWLFVAKVAPNTFGSFINNEWNSVWDRLKWYGDPSVTDAARFLSKGELIKFLIVLAVYLLFVVVFAAIAFMVFIGVPAGGGA